MTVLAYQAYSFVPLPPSVAQLPFLPESGPAVGDVQPPSRPNRAAAALFASGLVFQPVPPTVSQLPFLPESGPEIQSFQPPHIPKAAAAAMLATGPVYQPVPPTVQQLPFLPLSGPAIQDFQPPHPTPEKRWAAVAPSSNIEKVFANFYPWGFEPQAWVPPTPLKPSRWAAVAPSSNIESVFVNFYPFGFDAQAYQPPHFGREKSGALMPSDPGNQAPFSAFYPPGWEPTLPFLKILNQGRIGLVPWGDPGNQAPVAGISIPLGNWPFDAQQSDHLRIIPRQHPFWDDGIYAPYVFVPAPVVPVATPPTGAGDEIEDGDDARRRKWLEWARQKALQKRLVVRAPIAPVEQLPPRLSESTTTQSEKPSKRQARADKIHANQKALLAANLEAVKAAHAARVAEAVWHRHDDEEIALIMLLDMYDV